MIKRGFLNNTRKPTTAQRPVKASSAQKSSEATNSSGETVLPDVQIYAFEEKYFHETFKHPICAARTQKLASTTATMHPSSLICTRIPSTSIDKYGTTSSVLYFRTQRQLLQTPKFPSTPKPYDLTTPAPYIIRDVESKGKGMFATRALKVGELILVERPLLVIPINTDLSALADCPDVFRSTMREHQVSLVGAMEPLLEVAFARMSEENRKSYLELADAHSEDGTPKLTAIWRTNVFGFSGLGEGGDQYGAIIKVMSRVNHSCRPNCIQSFDKVSFSFELRATKPIAAGEEIVYAYCPSMESTTAVRQVQLKRYGFECTCASCLPESQNDALRTSLVPRLTSLRMRSMPFFMGGNNDRASALAVYDETTKLLQDLKKEGLEGWMWYYEVMGIYMNILKTLQRLSKSQEEGRKWRDAEKRYKDELARLTLASMGSNSPMVSQLRRNGAL